MVTTKWWHVEIGSEDFIFAEELLQTEGQENFIGFPEEGDIVS